jgi:hypothetical protein
VTGRTITIKQQQNVSKRKTTTLFRDGVLKETWTIPLKALRNACYFR